MRQLTVHESAILEASQKLSAREVAEQFEIMPQTVKDTLMRAYFKLGVANKSEAIAKAKELGILGG